MERHTPIGNRRVVAVRDAGAAPLDRKAICRCIAPELAGGLRMEHPGTKCHNETTYDKALHGRCFHMPRRIEQHQCRPSRTALRANPNFIIMMTLLATGAILCGN